MNSHNCRFRRVKKKITNIEKVLYSEANDLDDSFYILKSTEAKKKKTLNVAACIQIAYQLKNKKHCDIIEFERKKQQITTLNSPESQYP